MSFVLAPKSTRARVPDVFQLFLSPFCSLLGSSDTCAIASSGFQGDVKTLQKNLAARHVMYQHTHKTQMSCESFAQLLSNTLYFKRFFPYYTFNLLAGEKNITTLACGAHVAD